jgi:hypothetical protein
MKEKSGVILLVIFGVLVGFFCAEGIVRTWFLSHANLIMMNEYAEEERGKFARYDPVLGWDGKENAEEDFEWLDCRHHVRQNKFGYRGVEYDLGEKRGRRFVVLGDSVVWGFGVENEAIFTSVMEQRALRRIEMVNMGVSGYGTDQECLLWESKGRLWKPDEVILVVSLPTDLWENTFADRFDYPKPFFLLNAAGELILSHVPVPQRDAAWADPKQKVAFDGNRWIHFLLAHSAFADLLLNAASKNNKIRTYFEADKIIPARLPGYDHEFPLYCLTPDEQTNSAWRLFFALVDKLRADVEKSGARLTIVLAPSVVQVYPELWRKFEQNVDPQARMNLHPDAPGMRVATWCEKKNVRLVDLLSGLREAGKSNPGLYFPENMHWTPDGHRVAADILLKELHLND